MVPLQKNLKHLKSEKCSVVDSMNLSPNKKQTTGPVCLVVQIHFSIYVDKENSDKQRY